MTDRHTICHPNQIHLQKKIQSSNWLYQSLEQVVLNEDISLIMSKINLGSIHFDRLSYMEIPPNFERTCLDMVK